MKRIASVEDHKLTAAYDTLRQTLRQPKYAERLTKPLAFWALPGDRRLPMALLGYPIRDLLKKSLLELGATPGIGTKKLHSLVKLLGRVTKDQPPAAPLVDAEEATGKKKAAKAPKSERTGFDPTLVSEVLWEQWRRTVKQSGLGGVPLGRLAPSLEKLPTVIWRTPLEKYCDYTISQIRRLKTHGEKRVHAILEVFHSVYQMLGGVPVQGHLRVDVRPKFTVPIEQWLNQMTERPQPPTSEELKQRVTIPIVEQLKIDTGATIGRIVEERLGVKGPPHRVQQQAKRLGLTRARVYQLLETCGEAMAVRWPEGRAPFLRLYHKLMINPNARAQAEQLRQLIELIYPADEHASSQTAKEREAATLNGKAHIAKRGPRYEASSPRNGSYDHHSARMASSRR